MEVAQLAIDLLTAFGALAAAIGVLVLNNKFNRLQGKVETLEASFNAHLDAPGLHRS